MANEEDQCFQCQELGHIAHHCPNVCCYECDEYGHIAVDCPDRIPPSGMPACHKRQHSNTRHCTRSTSRHHHRRSTHIAGQDHSHTLADIEVTVTIIQTEVIPILITDATTGALYDTISPALIIITMTHHTGDHSHTEVHQLILEITADPDHIHHINHVRTLHLNPHPVLAGQQ